MLIECYSESLPFFVKFKIINEKLTRSDTKSHMRISFNFLNATEPTVLVICATYSTKKIGNKFKSENLWS